MSLTESCQLHICIFFIVVTLAYGLYQNISALTSEREALSAYQKIVLSAMNGDARFIVGDEAFECKGGSLGRVR